VSKVVVRRAADDGLAVLRGEALPKNARAPGVNLGRDYNDAMEIFLVKGLTKGAHFVGGVYDGRCEDVDGAVGNSLMQQEHAVVKFFTGVRDGEFFEGGAGFDGIGEPDLRGVALVVKAGRFEGAGGHAAAEDGDGGSFLRGIFAVEPAAKVQEGEQEEKKKRADEGENEAGLAGFGVGKDGRADHLDREIIRSKVMLGASSW